ncbi:LysR family transcriptional regulator [Pseudomonas sp. R-28-1W-6]|jgi:DNA-binding transcriptional LysR family regulator|uniref:LysR family transcriptional regulator n=1 Tax=Pseudomonas sp. R-28-1W-6 TaxID=2650101 RepID=UPI0013654F0A|nr:LysR family transcriptional regulator [Pseudomonas sp. R-28-1W-6]MWV14227.1 LysR family transcriptional regulator [Pseudomonas sp. R-28-1W-6]
MGLDDALIFTRVVECHSFTQAAQSLGMQKSTVSRRIALLEERLGVRLLNRTTRKLRLTEVGQAYYERCRQIMLDFAEAEQAVMQLQQEPSGLLRITAPIEFGQLFLGSVLGRFMRQYPQISAEVELTSRDVDPVEEGVDITIQVGQPHDSTLIARKLFETRRHLYASPEYLELQGMPQCIEDLAGHRAIILPQDSPRYWPLLGEHIACQRVLSCNNITLAREAALAGAGIATLPLMITEEAVQNGRLVALLPDARLPVGELYAVYPSRRFQAMKVKTFLDFLMASLPRSSLLEPPGAGLLTSRP